MSTTNNGYTSTDVYLNNIHEFESVVSQYISISDTINELLERIICKTMMNENYEKVNIILKELNRLLFQYYLQYHVTITSTIDNIVKVKVNDLDNIIYTTVNCSMTVIDAVSAILTIIIDSETTTHTVTIGETISVGFLDLTILYIGEITYSIELTENTLISLLSTYNVLQDLKLFIIDLTEINLVENNYDQSIIIKDLTTMKEKLECHKQYLIEKMDLLQHYKTKINCDSHNSNLILF
jgi:hypothetical protein